MEVPKLTEAGIFQCLLPESGEKHPSLAHESSRIKMPHTTVSRKVHTCHQCLLKVSSVKRKTSREVKFNFRTQEMLASMRTRKADRRQRAFKQRDVPPVVDEDLHLVRGSLLLWRTRRAPRRTTTVSGTRTKPEPHENVFPSTVLTEHTTFMDTS